MKIQLRSISDRGNRKKERIVLRVRTDTDIGDYLIMQTGFNDGEVTIDTYNTYWFPYKAVSAGDLIVLYTKPGKENEVYLGKGNKTHFFYWGLDSAIWDRNDRSFVVLHAPLWASKTPDEQ